MPNQLSKKRYISMMQKFIEQNKKNLENKSKEDINLIKGAALIFGIIFQVLVGIYYIALGTHFGVLYFTILTVVQLLTVIETGRRQIIMKAFSDNIDDFKFHRFYFLFNIVLDLVYYPLAFYLLLQ
jgi:hypothetical protein